MSEQFDREDWIEKIIDIEQKMFQTVNAIEYSPCQDNLRTFRLMRWMTHSVQSEEFLRSYRADLDRAVETGRNFMTEKYARMENRIPPLSSSPAIPMIVATELKWVQELIDKFPKTFANKMANFENYLSCDLETLSQQTLDCYLRTIVSALEQNRNLLQERYENLFRKSGSGSLEEIEARAQ